MKRGFTLVELIIYIGLMTLLLVGIASFSLAFFSFEKRNELFFEVEEQGIQVMRTITQTIRNSESISYPAQSGVDNFLNVSVYDTAKAPTIFSLSNNSILMQEGSDAAINLSSPKVIISNLLFTNLSQINTPGIIKIQFSVSAYNPNNRPELNFTKTFYDTASLR